LPPFALAAPGFHLRSLAALAARSALGGPREVLRRSRANAARSWLAALALPNASRLTIARAIEATAGGERDVIAVAWDAVAALVTPGADMAARAELRRVSLMLTPAT
jgi:hypothetical protein